MPKIEERISSLEARLKELKAKQTASETRKRATAARRQRKDDLRRKILVGAVVLDGVEKGVLDREQVWGWLDKGLSRREDRELFEGLGDREPKVEDSEPARSAGDTE